MHTLPRDLVIQHILTKAPQLGYACKEYYIHLPKIAPEQKENIRFPSPQNKNPIQIKHGNLTFEYEARIDFGKLNDLIEDENIQILKTSIKCPIFLEIKRIFEIILKYHISIIDGWKYKLKFIDIILRPGNCVFMPAHWFVSWTTTSTATNTPMVCSISYHTPISFLAFKGCK